MALIGKNNEERIWNFLKSKGLNAYGVAGLMGNLYAESALDPQNLQNTYERSLGFTDAEYTAAVDSGNYSNFVRDSAGYGLAQWTYWSRKEALLAYAEAAGTSIGDLETQLSFLYKELCESYASVLAVLKTATSVRQASDVVLTKFERPADQSENTKTKRAGYGQTYFDRYAETKTNTGKEDGKVFTPRTTKPEAGNKYYIRKASGGWSPAIKGSPTDKDCDVLSNCVGYAVGRFNEIGGYGCCKYLKPVNAENFIQYADGLEVGQTPKLGACMVWKKGATLSNSDGAGHVAIVEKIISDTEIVTSESGWGSSTPFWTKTRKKGSGSWGVGTGYTFMGFIYNPAPCCQNTGSSSNTSTDKTLAFKVGDIVQFTGKKHYTSANAASGPACKSGKAKVTAISKNGKHPYHLIAVSGSGSNVYGWVDADNVKAISSSSTGSTASSSAKAEAAQKFDKTLAGTYKTTAALNMRTGAGTGKKIMLTIPKGKAVQTYGYYNMDNSGTKWLYVVYEGVTGFCSSKYLRK